MKVLITGSHGQLGKEILCQMGKISEYSLFPYDIDKLDISNLKAVKELFIQLKPDVVINCAAFTAVDKCEEQIDLAYKVNALGPRNLAIAANMVDAKIFHISTDYVFDGNGVFDSNNRIRPYNEFDAINPQSIYGKTKAQGEQFVKMFSKKFFIIRTAWLYGDGKNFVKTMLSLSESRDVIKVVDDQVGSPTSTHELTKAILSLLPSEEYGIYHGTCQGQCSWYEFTKKIFEIKGIKTRVDSCTADEFPLPAKRPSYSVLDNYMFQLTNGYQFCSWEVAIENYLREI